MHKRPWTDEQRKIQEEKNTRTVYITGEDKDDLVRFFRHKPRQLSKELTDQANGQIDKVYLNKKGHLCVIAQNASQKNKLLKLNRLNNKSVTTSLPFVLNKLKSETKTTSIIRKPNADYQVKVVIYGLQESQANMDDIAEDLGADYMCRLGDPDFSNVTLVAFKNNKTIPSVLEIDNRKFKTHAFVPTPIRCDRCQSFGHLKANCVRDAICSRCTGHHDYKDCNIDRKCANCGQAHSAAYRRCPVYLDMQLALKIRAEENVPLLEAHRRVQELKLHNNNKQINKDQGINQNQWHKVSSDIPMNRVAKANVEIDSVAEASVEMDRVSGTRVDIDSVTVHSVEADSVVQEVVDSTADGQVKVDRVKTKVDSFLMYDKDKYFIIPQNEEIGSLGRSVSKLETFILGILSTIDNSENKMQAKLIISHVASQTFFDNATKFNHLSV